MVCPTLPVQIGALSVSRVHLKPSVGSECLTSSLDPLLILKNVHLRSFNSLSKHVIHTLKHPQPETSVVPVQHGTLWRRQSDTEARKVKHLFLVTHARLFSAFPNRPSRN